MIDNDGGQSLEWLVQQQDVWGFPLGHAPRPAFAVHRRRVDCRSSFDDQQGREKSQISASTLHRPGRPATERFSSTVSDGNISRAGHSQVPTAHAHRWALTQCFVRQERCVRHAVLSAPLLYQGASSFPNSVSSKQCESGSFRQPKGNIAQYHCFPVARRNGEHFDSIRHARLRLNIPHEPAHSLQLRPGCPRTTLHLAPRL